MASSKRLSYYHQLVHEESTGQWTLTVPLHGNKEGGSFAFIHESGLHASILPIGPLHCEIDASKK